MISHLRGRVITRAPEEVVIETNGVGYGVIVPLSTFYHLPEVGEETELFIHTQVRDEHIRLYGFSHPEEKKTFELLISIPDIGPRTAITILSGIPWEELGQAVRNNDRHRLQSIPRVGKKSAERIILELGDKLPVTPSGPPADRKKGTDEEILRDAAEALVNLGYRKTIAEQTVREVSEEMPERSRIEEIIKKSLQRLVR